MKRIAIVQSNYIPWKGYFDLIGSVDAFVLLDDVQYTRRDWRNRNRIKTPQGTTWLTVPAVTKGKYDQLISETELQQDGWTKKHALSLYHSYSKTPYFKEYWPAIEALYTQAAQETYLSRLNFSFITQICAMLSIHTPIHWSQDIPHEGDREQRLISICKHLGATHYLSGPAAAAYIPPDAFESQGIALEYADYANYPPYPQPHGDFEHSVTALDLLFCTGAEAPHYMKFLNHRDSFFRKAA